MSLEAAYAAGLIDGEGCIHLGVRKNTYRARVTIGMTATALPLLRWMQENWAGGLHSFRAATERWDAAWAWSVQGSPARQILWDVAPYLRLKGPQAALALQVEQIRADLPRRPNGGGAWTQQARDQCAELKRQMHLLNAKGPQPVAALTAVVG